MSRLVPLFAFLLLVALFGFGIWWNTGHDQREVPSPLIGKPAPAYALPHLDDPSRTLAKADMLGKPYLLNVFASWCVACGDEHPVLMAEGRSLGIPLVGYDYKDDPADAKAWLAQHGNPYDLVIADREGRTAIDFGVYGAPESFLIDARGVIRYKRIGPFTPEVIEKELKPRIAALRKEAP
ncbi:DsbE family thiol:disulfide interchange protein [Fulvimonas soli]|uniref:Cytochrome c biogenesis protein CcmG/thiol:disulfide interchange protein DsbE n=1 Tax=Fulvimonas soli TaxID=155197 RepID=A0A316IHB8_9GAMM|nr:DsbE family thiol:disulfide interchange protein [Fulvimonas soli]PWK92917.1 cytochrome c biogenesis protein CcmG/thiol:disulfide interchange protein DsbE [Fulvimonas soli]TNY26632.1 thiol:disulfide interchange protein [Fulvimonas soli]